MYINLTDDTAKTIIEALAASASMSDYYKRAADEADKRCTELMTEVKCRDTVINDLRKTVADMQKDSGLELREVTT